MSEPGVAVVTGGSKGIGRSVCIALAGAGYSVVLGSRGASEGRAVVSELRRSGARGLHVETDVSRDEQVRELVRRTVGEFGRLDVACNCAGTEGEVAPIDEQSVERAERLFAVNVMGVFLALKYEVSAMLRGGGGAVVNVASIAGSKGVPGSAPYSASKHAVLGLTRSAALEHARSGVRVNAVCPGLVKTDMASRLSSALGVELDVLAAQSPGGRLVSPDEVASVVVWLLSDQAAMVTGQAVSIDGGASVS